MLAVLGRRRSLTGTRVWIAREVLREIRLEALSTAPLETGGMLLGYRPPAEKPIVVERMIGPGPNAHHALTRFEPDGPWQEQELAELYLRSARRTTYLGDWHSHPRAAAIPSELDRRTARAISRHREARARRPLMLIMGGTDVRPDVRMYQYVRRRLRPVELVAF